MSEWYYTSAGQQVGPVSSAQLKQAAQAGQLTPSDLVWKDGMANWVPATKLRGLFDGSAPAGGPAAAPVATMVASMVAAAPLPDVPEAPADYELQPAPVAPAVHHQASHAYAQPDPASSIGYYNPTAGLGARVAANLKGFPPPTGPQGDWPLSESHLAELAAAEKHRKALRGFNSLCQLATLLCALGTVGSLFAVLATSSRGPAVGGGAFMFGQAIGLLIYVALTVLYYMAGKAALRCRMWGPITVVALLSLGILISLGGMFFGISSAPSRGPGPGGDAIAMVIAFVVILLIGGVMLYVAIRGMLAVPKFLACPVWAQEALVTAKL